MKMKLKCNHILFKDLKSGQTFMTDYLGIRHFYIKINTYQHSFLYANYPQINVDNSIDLESGNFKHFGDDDEVIQINSEFHYKFD